MHPELVAQIHDDYFAAGAEVAITNSYILHHDRLTPYDVGDRFEALHHLACEIAVTSRDKHGSGLVAGAIGPCGWSYRPDLAPPAERAAELYAEIAQIQKSYVDVIVCETLSSVDQARGAAMGAVTAGKPVWLAVSVDDEDGTKLRSGESVLDVLPLVGEFDIAALLINCSIPEAVTQAIKTIGRQPFPTGGYANGFTKITQEFTVRGSTTEALEKRENLSPELYADFVGSWIEEGMTIVGGCCEVGIDHIGELVARFK